MDEWLTSPHARQAQHEFRNIARVNNNENNFISDIGERNRDYLDNMMDDDHRDYHMDWNKLNRYLGIALDYTTEMGDVYRGYNQMKVHEIIFDIIMGRNERMSKENLRRHARREENIQYLQGHPDGRPSWASGDPPPLEEIAMTFYDRLDGQTVESNKKKIRAAKEKLDRQAATAHEREKAAAKRDLEKQKNRKNNKFCKNTTEYYTTEDIEDIPTEELTFIKFDDNIFCLDNSSYTNMMKHSALQKVRGDCKPPVVGKPLQCKWFYPILAAPRMFITEKSHNKRLKDINQKKQGRKFLLKNKKRINYDTGLHIMSNKTGFDDVYDLEPANYSIGGSPQSARIVSQSKEKTFRKYTVKQLKAECKKKGIKGYSKLKKASLILHCSVKRRSRKSFKLDKAKRSKQGWERGKGAPRKSNPKYKPVRRRDKNGVTRKVYILRKR